MDGKFEKEFITENSSFQKIIHLQTMKRNPPFFPPLSLIEINKTRTLEKAD